MSKILVSLSCNAEQHDDVLLEVSGWDGSARMISDKLLGDLKVALGGTSNECCQRQLNARPDSKFCSECGTDLINGDEDDDSFNSSSVADELANLADGDSDLTTKHGWTYVQSSTDSTRIQGVFVVWNFDETVDDDGDEVDGVLFPAGL